MSEIAYLVPHSQSSGQMANTDLTSFPQISSYSDPTRICPTSVFFHVYLLTVLDQAAILCLA